VAELERIAYDNALRALDKQERLLEELRARIGLLLAASSVATSVLGGRTLDDGATTPLVGVAVVAFLVALGASVTALIPDQGVAFALEPTDVYRRLSEHPDDLPHLHLGLAIVLQRSFRRNARTVKGVRRALKVAAGGLAVEVLALTLLLSHTA
jgi:hypothetical protein